MKCITIILILVTSVCNNAMVQAGENAEIPQFKLYKKLLDGYQLARPVKTWTSTVQVSLILSLLQIKELSSVDQRLTIIAIFTLMWNDELLRWNGTENGIQTIILPARKVWTPDFYIINSGNGQFIDSKWRDNYDILVDQGGNAVWHTGGEIVVSCNTRITFFPFDIQKCVITLGNWLEKLPSVNMTPAYSEMGKFGYQENSEWELLNTSVIRIETYPTYSTIEASLVVQRRYQTYLISVICPIILLSLMGTFIFALPPDSGEKITLGVTTIVGFSVFQIVVSEKLPQSSQDSPIIMIIIFAMMTLNGVSIILAVFILSMHHIESPPRLPSWIKFFTFNLLGRLVCKTKCRGKTATVDPGNLEVEELDSSSEVVEHESCMAQSQNGLNIMVFVPQILREIKNVAKRIEIGNEQDGNLGEWRKAASILDRALFYMFVLINVIILTVTLSIFLRGAN